MSNGSPSPSSSPSPNGGGSSNNQNDIPPEVAKATKAVAQSAALAVQDSVDGFRNLEAISTTAIGVALAQFLATKDETYLKAVDKAQSLISNGSQNLEAVGKAAATILYGFADGPPPSGLDPQTNDVTKAIVRNTPGQ